VKPARIDPDRLRAFLRRTDRGNLLLFAESAAEHVPPDRLAEIVRDFVRLEDLAPETSAAPARSLLDEVQGFQAAALRGQYYEEFAVNSKNCMDQSRGTDAFMAEIDRLLARCMRDAARSPAGARAAFEVLFEVIREIDRCEVDIVFFADEAGSWQLAIDWWRVLPAYFETLAATATADEFAREVVRAVGDLAEADESRLLGDARRIANDEQRRALPP